jgi:hypothetical protein
MDIHPVPSLDLTAFKQCLTDEEEHDIGDCPYGGGLHPLTVKGRKCGVALYKSMPEY